MKTSFRCASLLCSLLAASRPALPAQGDFTPSLAQVALVEKAMVLPAGARPLADYGRYYAGKAAGNKHTIIGVLMLHAPTPGITFSDPAHLPNVFDGGCGVIDVEYEVEARLVTRLSCHGVA